VKIILPIATGTTHDWQGSVKLTLGGPTVPVRIGSIPAGQTRQDVIHFKVDPGTHDIDGSLLIGP
jgi:hypothetical protein